MKTTFLAIVEMQGCNSNPTRTLTPQTATTLQAATDDPSSSSNFGEIFGGNRFTQYSVQK